MIDHRDRGRVPREHPCSPPTAASLLVIALASLKHSSEPSIHENGKARRRAHLLLLAVTSPSFLSCTFHASLSYPPPFLTTPSFPPAFACVILDFSLAGLLLAFCLPRHPPDFPSALCTLSLSHSLSRIFPVVALARSFRLPIALAVCFCPALAAAQHGTTTSSQSAPKESAHSSFSLLFFYFPLILFPSLLVPPSSHSHMPLVLQLRSPFCLLCQTGPAVFPDLLVHFGFVHFRFIPALVKKTPASKIPHVIKHHSTTRPPRGSLVCGGESRLHSILCILFFSSSLRFF